MDPRLGKSVADGALYKLAGQDEGSARMDFVLFHGLQPIGSSGTSYADTFRPPKAKNVKDFGLPELLAGTFPDARVLSMCYDSTPRSKTSLNEKAAFANLGAMLDGGVGKRPLFLIGHSLGGIVVKAVLKSAYDTGRTKDADRNNEFLRQLKAVVFIATPHAGANLAEYLKHVKNGPQVQILRPFSEDAHNLQTAFETLRCKGERLHELPVLSLREMDDFAVPWTGKLVKVKVVEPASAALNAVGWTCQPINLDHVAIAQPTGVTHPTFLAIKNFLRAQEARAGCAPHSDAVRVNASETYAFAGSARRLNE